MKRHTLVLLAVLLLAALPAAAQYTPYFQGDHVSTVEPIEVGATLVACDNLPWSIPASDYEYVWHGWLEAEHDELVLTFDVIYSVSRGAGYFVGIAPREWRVGKVFPWHDGLGTYAILYANPDDPTHIGLEAVSIHGYYADLFDTGLAFTGAPPIWWDVDPEHWLIQWRIEPFGNLVDRAAALVYVD